MVKVNLKKRSPHSVFKGYLCALFVLLVTIISFLTLPSLKPVGNKIKKKSLSKLRFRAKHDIEANEETTKMTAGRILKSGKAYLVYGTAWKKDDTARLVSAAIEKGFRFVDTACQPKHYNEAGVGQGWTNAASKLNLNREDLYLQTKFTSYDGQDPNNIPYDPTAELEQQVEQSFQKSLENLQTTYLDALVLHSPMRSMDDTIRVWNVFESFYDAGKVKKLGISNIYSLDKLRQLWDTARIKPTIVQNRFYSQSNFDTDLRTFCKQNDITYQSFWTLTGNRKALATPSIKKLAMEKDLSPQTLMYAYMMTLGHTPLDGTTSDEHMVEDMKVVERIQSGEEILKEDEMRVMEDILGVPR